MPSKRRWDWTWRSEEHTQFWKNMCYFAVSLEVTVNTTEVGDLCLPSCLLLVPAWDIIFG